MTELLVDTGKIRILKLLSNSSKNWWLFICPIILGISFSFSASLGMQE